MCYNYKIKAEKKALEQRYAATFYDDGVLPEFDILANGFTHLEMPVITNAEPHKIQFLKWGLVPSFVKDKATADQLSKMCLNAMYETINEKPSFRDSAKNKRCIIPATSFIEWQWTDLTKKNCVKQKYEIGLNNEIFSFAGLWSNWTNKETGEIMSTFSIITTPANQLMSEIHNNKKRMPLILRPDQEKDWLSGGNIEVDNNLPLLAIAV